MNLPETISRVEVALIAHREVAASNDPQRGDVVRCACQPRDAGLLTRTAWTRHVAEIVADEATRLLWKDPR